MLEPYNQSKGRNSWAFIALVFKLVGYCHCLDSEVDKIYEIPIYLGYQTYAYHCTITYC